MFSSSRAAFFGAIGGSALLAGLGQALASEPANLGNFLAGNTMGAPIAAAPPPGLWFASTAFYIPMASGNGNANCGPGVQGALQCRRGNRQFDLGYGIEVSRSRLVPHYTKRRIPGDGDDHSISSRRWRALVPDL